MYNYLGLDGDAKCYLLVTIDEILWVSTPQPVQVRTYAQGSLEIPNLCSGFTGNSKELNWSKLVIYSELFLLI